jgi:zinc protease
MPTLSQHILAWHTPAASLKTMDAAIQNVLVPYLVGTTSPLYKELVLDKQVAETIGSGYFDHRDPNLFSLVAVLKDEKNRAEVDAAFKRAVAELASGKVDKKRMEDIKSHLRYANLMALETTDQVAGKIAFAAAIYGTPDAYARSNQAISRVTSAQLAAFAKKYFTDANRTTLTLDYKPAAVSERAVKPATEGKN